jgi:hypothetical protein
MRGEVEELRDESWSAVYDGTQQMTKGNFQQIVSSFCRMGADDW